MPSNLLNRQSTVGYNNSLMKATVETKLGVNKSANLEMKSVGVRHKNGGSSKIKPSAHPRGGHPSIKVKTKSSTGEKRSSSSDSETKHDMVKVGLISAGLVSAFLVHRLFF
ncbi:hypothetical protein pdam_00005484 [Pocillopora damicornis]|uniref:Uncharacterized protein n=1 Tax=Pocillopora damicornis TaxID=46731 RepID=A0A3M6TAN0_POCDA|nr:hypothetical protein pdam_00005484 [Pocillopora damicornis]